MQRLIPFIPFIILLVFGSCYPSQNISRYARQHQLQIHKEDNISLFNGNLGIDSNRDNRDNKKGIYLVYQKDTLLFISNKSRYLKGGDPGYRRKKINDTVNILTYSAKVKYFVKDTILFTNNSCFIKTTDYEHGPLRPVHVSIDAWFFKNGQLILAQESYTIENNKKAKQWDSILAVLDPGKLHQFSEGMIISTYKDQETAMMTFFHDHIW